MPAPAFLSKIIWKGRENEARDTTGTRTAFPDLRRDGARRDAIRAG
jgi:hypothetical protein